MARKTKKVNRRPTEIRIGSLVFDLLYDARSMGAEFNTNPGTGKGVIRLGTKCKNPSYFANNLLHEIIEVLLVEDDLRWKDKYNSKSQSIFCFTHEDFQKIVPKIYDSMRSVGLINERAARRFIGK